MFVESNTGDLNLNYINPSSLLLHDVPAHNFKE